MKREPYDFAAGERGLLLAARENGAATCTRCLMPVDWCRCLGRDAGPKGPATKTRDQKWLR